MPSPETTADRQRFPFFTGGGEVGEATRAFEWSTSPIGPADQWPQSLKTLVSVMLGADQPMFVVWGPSRTLLYNQPYSQILATKHPAALGRDFLDVWSELRQDLIPIVHQAYDGEPVHMDDIELTMHRNGYPEETHFAFSYTPIRDEQEKVAGFFCACSEITQQVLAQRQQIAERERLNRMFQQAPGFRAMLEGPEHRFVLANPAYMQVVQHREVLGKTVAEALPEAVEQGYVTLLDRVFQSNEAFATAGARFEVSSAPGEPSCERFVDFVYQPVSDSEGRVTGIFVDGVDVTDRVINERRQAFRLALDERLRNLKGADAVLNAAARLKSAAMSRLTPDRIRRCGRKSRRGRSCPCR
jgi:PAS domain-containing protein